MTVPQAEKKFKINSSIIYSWIKKGKIPFEKDHKNKIILKEKDIYKYINRNWNKKCKFCSVVFSTKNENQFFCSRKCREKNWIKENPERDKELKKKSRLKTPVICKICNKNIPNEQRTGGKTYCDNCLPKRNVERRNKSKIQAREISKKFMEFKKSLGCSICGYNKFGGSLDFHHKNPKEKERRISHKFWFSQSELFKKEMKKCILLCKNCHYELHFTERNTASIKT